MTELDQLLGKFRERIIKIRGRIKEIGGRINRIDHEMIEM